MMTNREFTALLRKAAKIAAQAQKVQAELTKAFNDRYGTTYSDVDCDQLIDVLDYGGGNVPNAKNADEMMSESGAPPLQVYD